MHVGWHGLLLALCVVFLATPPSQAERFKLPGTECGRLPNTYECDDTPVGIGDKVLDDGQGRTPEKCTPGEFCPYGDVTYGFGRNHLAQLGVGDYRDRVLPTPLATAYAKIDLLRLVSSLIGAALLPMARVARDGCARESRGSFAVQENDHARAGLAGRSIS